MPGRLNSIFTRRGGPGEPAEEIVEVYETGGPPPPPPEPDPVRLRRERRSLARQREIDIRDVGGLAVEMVRRDRWKPRPGDNEARTGQRRTGREAQLYPQLPEQADRCERCFRCPG